MPPGNKTASRLAPLERAGKPPLNSREHISNFYEVYLKAAPYFHKLFYVLLPDAFKTPPAISRQIEQTQVMILNPPVGHSFFSSFVS